MTIGIGVTATILNDWFVFSESLGLDTYLLLSGVLGTIVVCIPNMLTIRKGMSILSKINLVTISVILLVSLIHFLISEEGFLLASIGTFIATSSVLLYQSQQYKNFLSYFYFLNFKKG
ncbi:membrane protein [Vibrio nigripulchritudo]|nr:membrane protein [Vibrio nigripulchritudo]